MKRKLIAVITMICVAASLSACNINKNSSVITQVPSGNVNPEPVTSEVQDPIGQEGENAQGGLTYNFEAHNPNEWQAAYKAFLEGGTYDDGDYEDIVSAGYYFLADIDDTLGSNIPELCIRTGQGEAAYVLNVYSYNPVGKTVDLIVNKDEIGAGHSTFYVGLNGDLYRYYGQMGYLQVDHIQLDSGKVSYETIFEEDINSNPDKGYTSMSEILGEETEPVLTAPFNNYAALIWYLNLPVETASMMDGKAADLAFSEVLSGNEDVYACGDEYYTGKKGLLKLSDLLEAGGMSKYDNSTTYDINMYCYTDANFDGLSEIMLRLIGSNPENPGADTFAFILLSFQEGQVYAYVMPDLTMDGKVIVCEYSVYHNWYFESYDYFTGIVFDKDVVLSINTDNNPKAQRPYVGGEPTWEVYDASIGY